MLCARSPVAGRAGRKNRSVGLISSHITKGAPSLFLPYVPLVRLVRDRSSGADLPPGRPAARSGSQTLAPKGGDAISGFVGSIWAMVTIPSINSHIAPLGPHILSGGWAFGSPDNPRWRDGFRS